MMSALATAGANDPAVRRFATTIYQRQVGSPVDGWVRRLVADALRSVQSLPYVPGPDNEEWMQPASYTVAHGGECKALSILFVSVCRFLRIPARVIWITQGGQPLNHVSAIVQIDGTWCWADASVRDARVCESPYDAIARVGAWHVIGQQMPAKTG